MFSFESSFYETIPSTCTSKHRIIDPATFLIKFSSMVHTINVIALLTHQIDKLQHTLSISTPLCLYTRLSCRFLKMLYDCRKTITHKRSCDTIDKNVEKHVVQQPRVLCLLIGKNYVRKWWSNNNVPCIGTIGIFATDSARVHRVKRVLWRENRLISAKFPNISENCFGPGTLWRGQNNLQNRSNRQTSILIWQRPRASPFGSLHGGQKTFRCLSIFSVNSCFLVSSSAISSSRVARPFAQKHRVIDLASIKSPFNWFNLCRTFVRHFTLTRRWLPLSKWNTCVIDVRLSFCTVGLRLLDLPAIATSSGKRLVDLKRANMHFHVGGFEIRNVAKTYEWL